MKDDAPTPERPPRKRRQLEDEGAVPDVWLAVWANDESLTPSERRRAQEERDRRKAAVPVRVLGFTGTRQGMSRAQKAAFREWVAGADELHHGDCIGADEQAHRIALDEGVDVVLHPPDNPSLRAWCQGAIRTEQTKPFLTRDRDIVQDTGALFAAPKELTEPADERRAGGTWYTTRYARKRGGTPIKVVYPDGRQETA